MTYFTASKGGYRILEGGGGQVQIAVKYKDVLHSCDFMFLPSLTSLGVLGVKTLSLMEEAEFRSTMKFCVVVSDG